MKVNFRTMIRWWFDEVAYPDHTAVISLSMIMTIFIYMALFFFNLADIDTWVLIAIPFGSWFVSIIVVAMYYVKKMVSSFNALSKSLKEGDSDYE